MSMTKVACAECAAMNRLPEGWRRSELVCGRCGGLLRLLSDEERKQPRKFPVVWMAEVPPGVCPTRAEVPPPPLPDDPKQLVMFAGVGLHLPAPKGGRHGAK